MHCSKCSEVIKPVVAIDIDGTLGDYHSHFISFALQYTGKNDGFGGPAFGYDGRLTFSAWFIETFNMSLEEYRQIKLAYRQGGMKRSMPIFDGARALCWSVRDFGAELWVTTTRPYLSLDNIVPDTVEWLRRHEIEYDGMLFDEDKYEQLATRVEKRRVIAVLDDLPEQVYAAEESLGTHVPILCVGKYNSAIGRGASMTCDLDAACDIILARITEWREQYGS